MLQIGQPFTVDITLKPSSVKVYQYKINKLKKNGIRDFNNAGDVIATIRTLSDNIQTQKSFLQAIVRFFPKLSNIDEYHEELNRIYDILRNTHTLTDSQQKSFLDWDEIINKRDKLKAEVEKTDDKYKWKRLLIISIYTYIPPRRLVDFYYMYCYTNVPKEIDEKINYYFKSEKLFVFNNYKTSHLYGSQEVDIPEDLFKIITKYTTLYEMKIGDNFLGFLDIGGLEKYIGDVFLEIMGKRITPNILRHSWSMNRDEQGRNAEEIRRDAELMSHSVEQEIRYVKKKVKEDKKD
jgi:hypothetical protein